MIDEVHHHMKERLLLPLLAVLQIILTFYFLYADPAGFVSFDLNFWLLIVSSVLFTLGFRKIAYHRQQNVNPDWDLGTKVSTRLPTMSVDPHKIAHSHESLLIEKGHLISRMLSQSGGLNFWRPREITYGVGGMLTLAGPVGFILIIGATAAFANILFMPAGEPLWWDNLAKFRFALLTTIVPAGILGLSMGGVLGGYSAYWNLLGRCARIHDKRGKEVTDEYLAGGHGTEQVEIRFVNFVKKERIHSEVKKRISHHRKKSTGHKKKRKKK
jgi:hypothetical protein